MRILCIKTLWGHTEGLTDDDDLARIKAAGFDGVEWSAPRMEPARWKDVCEKHGLVYIAQVSADTPSELAAVVAQAIAYDPILINAQDGRDRMTFEQGTEYLREALRIEADCPVDIAHETHRRRLLYTPWTTAQYLDAFPDLKICADFSHWCVVCESLLTDLEDLVEQACARAIHIHGRVGSEQAPQIADPRAPEFRPYLERHEQWWDRILELRKQALCKQTTFNPEFGPPGYMPTLPYTQQPVTNLWDTHVWMARRLRSRWEH